MRIQVIKSDATIVVEGDEAKFNELANIHGLNNVCVLDYDGVPVVAEQPAEEEAPAVPTMEEQLQAAMSPDAPAASQDPANPDAGE